MADLTLSAPIKILIVDDHAVVREGFSSVLRRQGVLSPILVRPLPEGFQEHFEIVTGARRFHAAKLAGLDSVPVRIVNLSDTDVLEIQVIELSVVRKRFFRQRANHHVVYM
jgi:ParB/RepB/Spo0J family partition protein